MAFPTGYTKYQEVTIDNTKVAADLTDYVIYIDLADLDKAGSDIFDTCRSDGGDIRVTKSDGTTELAREVVAIDTTAKTGELHVKFSGTLSSSSDTTIRIYYNGTDTEPAVTATYGRNAVWSDYALVCHNEDDPSGSAPQMTDSTGNNDGTSTGSMASGDLVAGQMEQGIDFDGTDDLIDHGSGSDFDITGDISIQRWAYHHSVSGDGHRIGKTAAWLIGIRSNKLEILVWSTAVNVNNRNASGGTTLSTNTWYKEDGVYDGSNLITYIDGSQDRSGSDTGSLATNSNSFVQGDASGGAKFDGVMDEIRIRASALSANWLSTEYNNQNSASTFYSTSDEQTGGAVTVSPAAQVLTFSLPAYSVATGVTVSPAAQVATLSIPAYSVSTAAVVSPSAQVATFSIPSYTIDAGGNVSIAAAVQNLTLSIPSYVVSLESVVTPSTQVATFSTPSPTFALGTGVTVTPAAQVATLSIPTYTITTTFGVVVSVATQVLTFTLPTLAKIGGVWTKRARETDATWSRRSVNDD